MSTKTPQRVDPMQQLVDRVRQVSWEAGDKMADLLTEPAVRARVDAIADRIDDLRMELARRLRHGETATRPLEDMTVEELHELAARHDIKGRSSMHKAELIDALRMH